MARRCAVSAGHRFPPWAYRVAYYQVLAQRRKQGRDRLRFDESLLAVLAEQSQGQSAAAEEEETLALCDRLKLPPIDRDLICRRYDAGASVKSMAADLNQPPNAVAVRLFRIRKTLLDCTPAAGFRRGAEVSKWKHECLAIPTRSAR